MAPINLIIARLANLDEKPLAFISDVEKAQAPIFKELVKKLNRLNLDSSGNIIFNTSNLAEIEKLGDDLRNILSGKGTKYYDAVSGFLKEMEAQKDLNKSFFQQDFDFENDPKFDKLFKESQERAVDRLANAAVDESIVELKEILQTSISTNNKFTSLVENIHDEIAGIDSKLVKYARNNATDIFTISDREYVNAISEELEVEFFEFAGGISANTRSFCKKRNGKIFHKKEIEAWAKEDWEGKAKNTNSNTIFSLLGGYRCDHVLVPIALKYVPVDVLERNIDSGNIRKMDLPPEIIAKLAA